MKCMSASTSILDAYRAGLELGESLRAIAPEAVVLFPSVHYSEEFEDLFAGLYDGLENRDLLVVGGTGDGFYEGDSVESIGVGAMAFHGGDGVRWGCAMSGQGAVENPRVAAAECASNLIDNMGAMPDLAITFAPMGCDGTLFAQGIREVMTSPCVGALTGDDRQFKGGAVLANGRVVGDAAVMLGIRGAFHHATRLGNGYAPVGALGVIEQAEGTTIHRISGLTATAFVRKQWGAPMSEEDLYAFCFGVFSEKELVAIRSPNTFDNASGSIRLFGSVPEGTEISICSTTKEQMLSVAADMAVACSGQISKPTGAFVISCAGRKWLLAEEIHSELKALGHALPDDLPILGLPSFGEFSPPNGVTSISANFHNVTCVMTLFGEAP